MYTSTTQQNVMSLRGLSTDTKPVDQMWLENGSVFLEMDTCKVFVYDGENKVWIEQTDGGEGGGIVIDSELSSTSENPVQNKVITNALGNKADLVGGKVPENQLPSYVDDVLEYADVSSFPAEGESGKIYVALDTNITYRWSGSAYVQVGPNGDVVIANPTLAGDEADLEGLQVGQTKYKVPGGGSGEKLYRHDIILYSSTNATLTFTIINSSNEKIFKNNYDLYSYLQDNNYTSQDNMLSCVGGYATQSFSLLWLGMYYNGSNLTLMSFDYKNGTSSFSTSGAFGTNTYIEKITQIASNTVNVAPDIHLYRHDITLIFEKSNEAYITKANITAMILSSDSTPFTVQLLSQYLSEHYTDNSKGLSASGAPEAIRTGTSNGEITDTNIISLYYATNYSCFRFMYSGIKVNNVSVGLTWSGNLDNTCWTLKGDTVTQIL